MDFENKKVHGIHVSRYLASFYNGIINYTRHDGDYITMPHFYTWLEQLTIDGEKLTEDEIDLIYTWATCGKLELEFNAERFVYSIQES